MVNSQSSLRAVTPYLFCEPYWHSLWTNSGSSTPFAQLCISSWFLCREPPVMHQQLSHNIASLPHDSDFLLSLAETVQPSGEQTQATAIWCKDTRRRYEISEEQLLPGLQSNSAALKGTQWNKKCYSTAKKKGLMTTMDLQPLLSPSSDSSLFPFTSISLAPH